MDGCIFCRIVAREIPAREVARNAHAVAFHDLHPQAPVHVLVIPVRHYDSAAAAGDDQGERDLGAVLRLGIEVAAQLGLAEPGYRFVMNTGRDGGQSVGHVHLHLLGGRAMHWPPG